ncbi:MAG: hypothetical protein GAK33_04114 [Burkholderia lata]|uniref:Uncharacterized protein n=1 Tax=Burkholderia lata (strain ATCC 17760 / DSM 23089 / LMG 22485 / NCIMB 9086 / R18194 / 383) TaxID=482957 RepID=A0A833PRJ6_BURL3|nr:MAG: hypothetical protein GAK33_04114 [Burkholderia lata]
MMHDVESGGAAMPQKHGGPRFHGGLGDLTSIVNDLEYDNE